MPQKFGWGYNRLLITNLHCWLSFNSETCSPSTGGLRNCSDLAGFLWPDQGPKLSSASTFLISRSVNSVGMFVESHGFLSLLSIVVPGWKGQESLLQSLEWSLGSTFMNQWRRLMLEVKQVIQSPHKRFHSLCDFLHYLWNAVWQEGLASKQAIFYQFSLSGQPSIANQFAATQEVFGEWSFQLFVNTSELGHFSMNSPHKQRPQCIGFSWYF